MATVVNDPKVQQSDVLMFRIIGRVRDQNVISHINCQLIAAVGAESKLTATGTIGAFRTLWRSDILPEMSAQYSIIRYEQRICTGAVEILPAPIPPAPGRKLVYSSYQYLSGDPTLDVGAVAGEILPTPNAVLVNQVTGNAGRGLNGNLRLGPVLESQQADGRLILAGAVQWQTIADVYSDQLALTVAGLTDNYRVGVFQLRTFLKPNVTTGNAGAALIPFASWTVNPNIRTQVTRRGPATLAH